MSDLPPHAQAATRSSGLLWIAIYKMIKTLAAGAGAFLILRIGKQNVTVVAHHWLDEAGIDPGSHFGAKLLDHAAHLTPHRLRGAAIVLFVYAGLYCLEGVGLFLQKRWAEWLTVVQTALIIPLEIYELATHPTWLKIVALLVSVAIVAYLLLQLRGTRPTEKPAMPSKA